MLTITKTNKEIQKLNKKRTNTALLLIKKEILNRKVVQEKIKRDDIGLQQFEFCK